MFSIKTYTLYHATAGECDLFCMSAGFMVGEQASAGWGDVVGLRLQWLVPLTDVAPVSKMKDLLTKAGL